jgi:flagellar motor switch protein FliN
MTGYLDCWTAAATALFSQALAGEPELRESLPKPMTGGSFGFEWTLSGDEEGRFVVLLDAALLQSPLLGEGVDQRAGWGELLREVAGAAAGDMLPKAGKKCAVEEWKDVAAASQVSKAFQLKSVSGVWTILVRDETHARKNMDSSIPQSPASQVAHLASASAKEESEQLQVSPGIELLLDVEVEAALRFGCREMPLGEILDLGAGDVVELDRHVTDPVDLLVGDRIVARGEVVLVNGDFGLRVTEVVTPRKRLESVRCLF